MSKYCDECVAVRDVLIQKLATYSALQTIHRDLNAENAAEMRRADEEIGEAKAAVEDHAESHR
jgi:hypothetical protein